MKTETYPEVKLVVVGLRDVPVQGWDRIKGGRHICSNEVAPALRSSSLW